MTRKILTLLIAGTSLIANCQFVNVDNPIFTSDSLIEDVESANWSLAGESIVFSAKINGQWDMFLYNLKNDSLVNISKSVVNERSPIWHPNGKEIIYDIVEDDYPRLYKLNIELNEKSQLFQRDIKCAQASFSKSPNLVCFRAFNETSETWQIYSYDFIYDNLNQLTSHNTSCNNPVFSPDGKHILYELITQNSDTILQMINWYGNRELETDTLIGNSPSWGNQSWRFSYVSSNKNEKNEIYSLRRAGNSLNRLTNNNLTEKEFSVSPNGNYAAIIIKRDKKNRLIIVRTSENKQ
jgi:Tol biopolymer transport system component